MFSDTDLDAILAATGEDITITLSGVTIKTIQAKFREDFEEYGTEGVMGLLKPGALFKPSDLNGVTNDHTYLIRNVEYRRDGKPQRKNDGFILQKLAIKT